MTSGRKTTSAIENAIVSHVTVDMGSLDGVNPYMDFCAIPAKILYCSLSCYVMAVDSFVHVASTYPLRMVKAV